MVYLHGIGHFHPENILDNAFFESLNIDTNNEWIMQRVGIAERRTVLPLEYIQKTYNQNPTEAKKHAQYNAAKLGAKATQMALERAGLQADDIGMVIAGSCSPEYALPANAAVIAAELGITAEAIDVHSACSTFAAHLHLINRMDPKTLPDYILLVIPETWTTTIDYKDRKTAVLIGDCAVATIVSRTKESPYKISHSCLTSDPAGWSKVVTPTGKHFNQEGPAVQKFAIKKTLSLIKSIREKTNIDVSEHYFIGHQANLMMLKSVCRMADIAPEKHFFNVDRYGNCGAAGAPSVLSQNWETFKSGDTIIIAVVGAGLTWSGVLVEVGEKF